MSKKRFSYKNYINKKDINNNLLKKISKQFIKSKKEIYKEINSSRETLNILSSVIKVSSRITNLNTLI